MPELFKEPKRFALLKVDEQAHMVWGIAASEAPDSDDEICDYTAAKAAIKKWSDETLAKTTSAGQDPSLGNIRVMHQLQVGGKAIKIEYRDDSKEVWLGSEPANDDVWHLLKGGFLTGYSIGGGYAWKRPEGSHVRYAPEIGEVSYVDRPANPDASFAYVKADGTTELRKFAKPGPEEQKIIEKLTKADKEPYGHVEYADPGYQADKQKRYPIDTEEHIRAAWNYIHQEKNAAKYSAEHAAEIKSKIIAAWKKHVDEAGPPASKAAIIGDLLKTYAEISEAEFQKFMTGAEPAKGTAMTSEELKKAIEKAAGGNAELEKTFTTVHGHLMNMHKAHIEHHDAMHKAHTEHMHEMHGHIAKAMKALGVPESGSGSVTGGGELHGKGEGTGELSKAAKERMDSLENSNKELAKSMESLTKTIEELRKAGDPTERVKLHLIDREGKEIKKTEADTLKDGDDLNKAVGF